jgi:DNA-binding LytR/AlgR family response regulator
MLHIAICDDQKEHRKVIRSFTEYYIENHNIKASIRDYDNALVFLEELDQIGGFDILLLDICMPGILGTEAAKEIRLRGDKTEIIFLTTSNEFAVDAFALKATHYLLKPFTQTQFDEAMDRAVTKFTNGQVMKITLKLENGMLQLIDINDIHYIESAGHIQRVYMENGVYKDARCSLARLAEELEKVSPKQFINPYKGYIVNQKVIRTIEPKQMELLCGKCLPLSRGNFRQIQDAFIEFQFNDGVHL